MDIIYTTSAKSLAEKISKNLTLPLYAACVRRFRNGELSVSVPKKIYDAILISSTVTNDDWIELILLLDALKDARRIILCMPFMGYTRQDKYMPGVSFGFQVFSTLIEAQNVSHFILLDNHTTPIFKKPTINLSTAALFEAEILRKYPKEEKIIVSPDLGSAKRAERIARALKSELALISKKRDVFGILRESTLISGEIKDKLCIIIDDMVDSGQTLVFASQKLKEAGAFSISSYASHGLLNERCVDRIKKSDIIELVLTDSINCDSIKCEKIRKLSVASLISEAIKDILVT